MSKKFYPVKVPKSSIPPKREDISIYWCSACNAPTMNCPKCGNNCCNGTYGDDGKCTVCPDVYNLAELLFKNKDLDNLIMKLLNKTLDD